MTLRANVLVSLVGAALWAGAAWSAPQAPSPRKAAPAPKRATPTPAKQTTEQAAEAQIGEVLDTIVDALWAKTDEYWHSGEFPPIVGICRQVVELDPHFVDAYTTGAWMAESLDQDAAALEFYRLGMERNPSNWELPHQLGFAYHMLHKRDVQSALPYLKRAAELGSPIYIKRSYAHALTKAGRYHEAAKEWHKILKLDPKDRFAPRELETLRAAGRIGPKE